MGTLDRLFRTNVLAFIVLGLGLMEVGCLSQDDQAAEDGTVVDIITPDVGTLDPDKVVCDPFGASETQGSRDQGVIGRLFYRDTDQPRWYSAVDYINNGVQTEVSLFFNRISIPTRPFDRGFTTQNGQVITTNSGNTLYEYFALSLETELQLGSQDEPGLYELAILSDDGALLWAQNGNGEWDLVVDSDGDHSTRMGCSVAPLYLGVGEKIPIRINYYQGPRYHIALSLMWRPWTESGQDIECGKMGNERYWDYTQDPPAPTSNLNRLISRGWRVLADENYRLPSDVGTNPCNSLPAPTISEIRTPSIGYDQFEVTWKTDILASSQVRYTNNTTGQTFTTEVNKEMVTAHRQVISGLQANTIYRFTVRSVSGSGKVSESPEVTIKTLR